MKKFSDLSIKVKVPLLVGGASFVVMALVCLFLILPLRSNSLDSSTKIAQLSAIEAGERLAESVNSSASVVRAYSGIIAQIASSDIIPNGKKRELLMMEMETLVKSEKRLTNIWCTLEPDALDGMDSLFVNGAGSNSHGIFAPWFADGEITASENDYEADYYAKPKEHMQEYLTEPYWDEVNGKKIHMFSICIPIISNGKFIGVTGTDFHASDLNLLISSHNKGTVGKLVTHAGTIAVCHDPEYIGQQAEQGNRKILDKLSAGEMFEGMYPVEGMEMYKVYIPIHLGNSKPWFYAVDVPKPEIYAQARETAGYLIVYCLIGIILIACAGWFLMQSLLKGVTTVTSMINQLSSGRINLHIDSHQSLDEIGKMKTELGSLVGGLQRTANFARNIGDGNLNAEYQPLSGDDVLGNSLLEMRRSLQKAATEEAVRKNEEEQRNWVTAGLAKFGEILRRDNSNLEALSYNIISSMVKYLGANQGGIYILDEDDDGKVLDMKACYAFNRRKSVEKQIRPGEGLVGTCYLESEMIYLTELPENYITITSGLGDSNPRALLICPLKVNGEIYGIIELASFREFEPYQREFVQKVSESIAATISTVRVNIRTERLLEQTKLQAEEMTNQEEELRQNMEEMQATQEEMRRREIELSEALRQMEEIQKESAVKDDEMSRLYHAIMDSFDVVEFSPDGYIVDVNRNVLESHHAPKEVFLGKTLSDVSQEPPEVIAKVFDNLRKGISQEIIQNINANGQAIKFNNKLVPMIDADGKLYKVILYAYKTL